MGSIIMASSIGTPFNVGVVGVACCWVIGARDFNSGAVGTVTFTVSSGALPPGLSLLSPTQQTDPLQPQWCSGFTRIEGTATTPGSYTFNVHGVDSMGNTGDIPATIVISATQTNTMTLPRASLLSAYSFTFDTNFFASCFGGGDAGTVGPWTTTATGAYSPADLLANFNVTLSAGVLASASLESNGTQALDGLSGPTIVEFIISGFKGGNPHTLANHGFCAFEYFVYVMNIGPAPPNGTVGVPYSATFVCSEPSNSEYTPVFTFTGASTAGKPPGLTFDLASGTLHGTPTVAGVFGGTPFGFFVAAIDQAGLGGDGGTLPIGEIQGYQIMISAAPSAGGAFEGTHVGFLQTGHVGGGTK